MNDFSTGPSLPSDPSPGAAPAAAGEVSPAQPSNIPEDLRTPWDLLDLVIFLAFGLCALVVVTNAMATLAVTFFGVNPHQLEKFATGNAPFIVLRQVFWFGSLLIFLYAIVRRRTDQPVWRTLGWRKLTFPSTNHFVTWFTLLFSGAVLAFVVQIVSRFVTTEAKLPIEALFSQRRNALWMMGFGILVAPLAEETVFRGYIYPVLARKLGAVAGILLTGTLFGLMHAPQLWGGWGQIVLLVVVGMIFTTMRAWTGTVLSSYLLHLGYNALLFAGFFFATGGLQHLPPGT